MLLTVLFMCTLIVMILQRRKLYPRRQLLECWIHICKYNYDLYFAYIIWENMGVLCMQIIHLLVFLYSKHQKWENWQSIGKGRCKSTMRGWMKELSWMARMSLIMGSSQWTPMSWSIGNKVGVVILIRGIGHADAQCP